jgi:hypothetical protein
LATIASKVTAAELAITKANAAFEKAQTDLKKAALSNAKDIAFAQSADEKT